MEFFDHLGKRVGEMVKQVEEKSGEWLELGKLNMDIFREEETVRKICRRMGERVYEAYAQGMEYSSLPEDCREIDAHKQRIGALRQKAEEIKRQPKERAPSEEASEAETAASEGQGSETASCPCCGR